MSQTADNVPVGGRAELDALGDELGEEEEGIPSYLRETPDELPDFVDEAPQQEKEPVRMGEGVI